MTPEAGETLDLRDDFDLDPTRIWLNTAHQGALPRVSADEARLAISWKLNPHELTTERFGEVPRRLKESLGALIEGRPEDIILTNGASYGVHLLANGLPLEAGDEVLVMKGDFPSNVLPWLGLEERGVLVRRLEPAGAVLTPEEVGAALTKRTRIICLSYVHSFSGWALDIPTIGRLCRANGTWLAVNASQALGARALRIGDSPIDALVCAGWKWLCGPYGTGFAWLRASLRQTLRYNQAYWLSAQTEASLRDSTSELRLAPPEDSRRYDLFGTANFFNFMPFRASVDYIRAIGCDRIETHLRHLIDLLTRGLDSGRFRLLSASSGTSLSSLIVFSHVDPTRNVKLYERLTAAGVAIALRRGCLRISPHLYNIPEQIEVALRLLHDRE